MMKKFIRILIFVLIFLGVITVITIVISVLAGNKVININLFSQITPTPNPYHQLSYSAWIPDWGINEGLTSLKTNAAKFDYLSPVWYEVKEDGSLINKKPKNAAKMFSIANKNDIKLVPAIAMFDHELFTKVLQNQENLQRHITAIYDLVVSEDYAGIDLDYESTKLQDKEQYFAFLAELSAKLHQADKILIVTVLAKWGDAVIYPSLPETRIVQDWSRIAELADQVRIMAYDYTYSKTQFPGPIAPVNWIKDILDYAVTKIPREKIILGIHLYAYEWWLEVDPTNKDQEFSSLTFITNYLLNNSSDKAARAYTYDTVLKVLAENQGERSEYQGEQIFKYQKTNSDTGKLENRILIYIDPVGVRQREQLAKDYQIAGVSYWRLGREADLLD